MLEFRKAKHEDAEAIHRLNYETFVEEIPQHPPNLERRLIDRFHEENTYWVGEANQQIVAMCAMRDRHPFSLELKGVVLPPGNWMEIRLLAVKPDYRNNRTFAGLMRAVLHHAIDQNVEGVLINGTTREQKLYSRFGFIPFSDPIGTAEASYIPMMLKRDAFFVSETARTLRSKLLLAGPVELSVAVRSALGEQPYPHRSKEAKRLLETVQSTLSELVKLPFVYTLLGSGTVANDAAAGQLEGHGLIVDTGEFGRRLIDHAKRAGLTFDVISSESTNEINFELATNYDPQWIWMVHCETSTGVLYNLEPLVRYARKKGARIVIDAVSTVGTIKTDYSFADIITFVSGKALRNAPGLSFVAMRAQAKAKHSVPRYLDLNQYNPIAFTQSFSLIKAMKIALDELTESEVASHQLKMNVVLETFQQHGLMLPPHDLQSPGIVTVKLPSQVCSVELGRQLNYHGYLIQYESDYLRAANCIQLSTMGWSTERDLKYVATYIASWIHKKTATPLSDGFIKHENLDGPNDESFVQGALS